MKGFSSGLVILKEWRIEGLLLWKRIGFEVNANMSKGIVLGV